MKHSAFIISLALTLYHTHARSLDTLSADDYDTSVTELPTACNDLEDGYHWIRPIADGEEYPNIYVKCVDGYTMLDPSLMDFFNYHHIKALFTTYNDVTDFVASSSLNDHVTWEQWYLPAANDPDMKWAISEDCSSCAETDEFGDKSTYYMTGNYNGCLWVTKGYCDMDPDTLECYECTAPHVDEPLSGLCSHMIMPAWQAVKDQHEDCVGDSYNQEPSIGTEGEFCQCYKPKSATTVPAGEWVLPDTDTSADQDADTVIEVYSGDFADGTYRITAPGVYKVMEDIEFEMNAGSHANPNDEGQWYPREDQEREYMGSGGTFIGPYGMGFFAGFAIESDDVTIDLNGHELKMSRAFHHQQRWFSIIEVGSKAFISGQGPANFGPYMVYANNVEIKNGIVGRSSHHGIHANGFENLYVHDVVIKDFEVAGMALNGFVNAKIENVEVGPVYQEVPVMGVFTQARIMLPRLRNIMENNPEGTVTFHNRPRAYTAGDLYDELVAQMDIMFDHNINGVAYEDMDESEERIAAARDVFENKNGLPSSSTAYGIFLNSYGASVFAISGAPGHSDGLEMNNVRIHGLYKDPWEVPRIVLTKGPFNDIMDFTRHSSDGLRTTDSEYIGSAYTDVQFAINQLAEDWGVLGHSVLGDDVIDWISSGKPMGTPRMICNGDIMLHVTKGVFGLRIDNVLNVNLNNIEIDDLQNIAELGSYICGNYDSTDNGGHRNQNFPLQRGFTGTEVHALSFVSSSGKLDNVHIHNIVSARGDALAMQFFPGNAVEIGANVRIEDIHAGAALSKDVLGSLENSMPNKIPRACAITVWTWTDEDSEMYANEISFADRDAVTAKCLTTHTACDDSIYDGEALPMENVAACDSSTIVKSEAANMDNRLLYSEFISKVSPRHQKLFDILESHPAPHFFPPRAFPDHVSNLVVSEVSWTLWCLWTALYVVAGTVAIAVVYQVWRCFGGVETDKLSVVESSDSADEYKPLVRKERISLGSAADARYS